MDYVGLESAKYARRIQDLLAEAPKEAGILFASVRATAAEDGISKEFDIVMGMRIGIDVETGLHVADLLLGDILKDKKQFSLHIFSGVPGKGI